jgi:signal transduction histidine kinase
VDWLAGSRHNINILSASCQNPFCTEFRSRIVGPNPADTRTSARGAFPWTVAAYASFSLAIAAVLIIAGWAAYLDFEESRTSLLQAEINRVRSHAARTALRIQSSLTEVHSDDLHTLNKLGWLREHWERFSSLDPSRLYTAVIDNDGVIVAHSNPENAGKRLPSGWYTAVAEGVGDDAVVTSNPELTGGGRGIDVRLPIEYGGREIGTYHSGFDLNWFEHQLDLKRDGVRKRWALTFAFISIVIAAAGLSLWHITRRLTTLQSAIALGHVRRLADLGQLAGGIAHEVRNPLNAIRLNLHVIERLLKGQAIGDDRMHSIINESVREMDRVDGLLRMLLSYARPDKPRSEVLDLSDELPAVAEFIRPIIERDGIRLTVDCRCTSCFAAIDRSRFRQITINLLKNAAEAAGPDGQVDVALQNRGGMAEIVVRDSGTGIDPRLKDRIFEPFFTTKDVGTGLGLSLVKRYVEEADGTIEIRTFQPHGAEFAVAFPITSERRASEVEANTAEATYV